ncbi:MAG: hypothetical protein IME96_03935 [Proteobacteria bacterium]|nr:hypothetical protein [Pseudomonadota bacterium]
MSISIYKCKKILFTSWRGALLFAAIITFLPGFSAADEWHYKDVVVGDRAAGMGGAYSAIADTPEGAYYNPAGIVYSVGRSLSVSVNAYRQSWTTYDSVLGGGDWNRKSSSLVPNFFGMIQPMGKGKIAFSYAVPDVIEEDQNQIFYNINNIDTYVINLSNLDKTYKLGPSYAQKLSDTLSVGATLYLHYRQEKLVLNQYLLFNDTTYEWSNTNLRRTEYGVHPKVGFMWSPVDKMSFGLTISKVEIFESDARTQSIVRTDSSLSSLTDTADPTITTSDDERKYPLSVSLGSAWFPSESLLLSCDLDYFAKISSQNRQDVLNFSIGAEYYQSEKYAYRGGFYTNMTSSADLTSGVANQVDQVHMYGIAASIVRFTRTTSMSFGFNYAFGKGDAQPISNDTTIYDSKVETLTLFMSGAYSF